MENIEWFKREFKGFGKIEFDDLVKWFYFSYSSPLSDHYIQLDDIYIIMAFERFTRCNDEKRFTITDKPIEGFNCIIYNREEWIQDIIYIPQIIPTRYDTCELRSYVDSFAN